MSATRAEFINAARQYIGTPFSHQGRSKKILDCGGLVLLSLKNLNLSSLEELGYASFPVDGRFDQLLTDHADALGFTSRYPHKFDGTELLPGDLLSFDYNNGEGTRHIALVTKFEDGRYWILDAQPVYGVTEKPFSFPFSKATVTGWRVRGLID